MSARDGSTYLTLQGGDGSLIGAFAKREVALRIAHELLPRDGTVLLQTFDGADRLIREELISLGSGLVERTSR